MTMYRYIFISFYSFSFFTFSYHVDLNGKGENGITNIFTEVFGIAKFCQVLPNMAI